MISAKAASLNRKIDPRSSVGMLASAWMDWPSPSSRKARAKARNSESRVRRQKRRKNSAQAKKPSATAPDRKSYKVEKSRIFDFPDETPDQRDRKSVV